MFLHDINTIHYRYRVAAYIIQETKINLCSMFLYLQFPWNVGFGLGLQAYAVPYSSKVDFDTSRRAKLRSVPLAKMYV